MPCLLQVALLHSLAEMRSIYRANLRTRCFALAYRIASRIAYSFTLIAPHSRPALLGVTTFRQSGNAILWNPRAMFSYRLLLFISCYCIARHSINGLGKRGPSHKVGGPLLLRLAAHGTTAQDKATHPPHHAPRKTSRTLYPTRRTEREAGGTASHPTPPVVGGGGLGTAPQGKKTT